MIPQARLHSGVPEAVAQPPGTKMVTSDAGVRLSWLQPASVTMRMTSENECGRRLTRDMLVQLGRGRLSCMILLKMITTCSIAAGDARARRTCNGADRGWRGRGGCLGRSANRAVQHHFSPGWKPGIFTAARAGVRRRCRSALRQVRRRRSRQACAGASPDPRHQLRCRCRSPFTSGPTVRCSQSSSSDRICRNRSISAVRGRSGSVRRRCQTLCRPEQV